MQPISRNVTIRRGDTFKIGFRLAHMDDDGNPVYDYNFTGWTGKAQLRRSANLVTVELEFDVAIADQSLSPGLVWVTAAADDTAALDIESGVYDVQLTSPTDEVMTIAEGDAEIAQDVTRP